MMVPAVCTTAMTRTTIRMEISLLASHSQLREHPLWATRHDPVANGPLIRLIINSEQQHKRLGKASRATEAKAIPGPQRSQIPSRQARARFRMPHLSPCLALNHVQMGPVGWLQRNRRG